MKRSTYLLILILLSGSGSVSGSNVTEKSDLIRCYTGYEGAISIESGYNYCFMSIDFMAREVQYLGVEGLNHPFDNTKIDMKQGPCFVHYSKDNTYTYCYCRRSLCNTPQKPFRNDRAITRLLAEERGRDN